MGINKLISIVCFIGVTMLLASCSSCSDNDRSSTVSREVYNELQQKYDMLKDQVEGTISSNEEAKMELNSIMVELNTISGRTISLQKNLETGKGQDTRTTAARIRESITDIKRRLDGVSVKNADNQTLALIENLRQTIALNEQEIDRLNNVIDEKNQQISTLDTELTEKNGQLQQTLEQLRLTLDNMRKAEIKNWISMGDELVSIADLLPDVKGHGNMKEIKKAKLTILLRAKSAYNQAYQLGEADALAKVQIVDTKYQQVSNR